MSCNRYQFDMSLNLDGRLPSGRREVLMSHIAECCACSRFWDEMQRAQELASSLPEERTGNDFDDALWHRIRSGEGTPHAVYLEPMPVWHKVRYVATGAAAAAAILLGIQLLRSIEPRGDEQDVAQTEIARDSRDEQHPTPGPQQPVANDVGAETPIAAQFAFQPLDPPSIARAGWAEVVDSMYTLQSELERVEVDTQAESRVIRARLSEPVRRLRGVTGLMFWLQDQELIVLPGDFQSELERTDRLVRKFDRADERRELLATLHELRELDVRRMDEFEVKCCKYPADFQIRFRDHFQRNPDVRTVLEMHVVGGNRAFMIGSRPDAVQIMVRVENETGRRTLKLKRRDLAPQSHR